MDGGGRRRGQKAGQGDADLDGGQKVGRVLGQLENLPGFFVPFLRHFLQLGVVERNNGDFRRGKKGVEKDEDDHQQDLPEQITRRSRVRHGRLFPLSDAAWPAW